jgi:hypothetical protein
LIFSSTLTDSKNIEKSTCFTPIQGQADFLSPLGQVLKKSNCFTHILKGQVDFSAPLGPKAENQPVLPYPRCRLIFLLS